LLCGFKIMRTRRNETLSKLAFWTKFEADMRRSLRADPNGQGFSLDGRSMGEVADDARSLRIKYARAARYPWLPVAPDPPEPE
jgi:hypothetical protein